MPNEYERKPIMHVHYTKCSVAQKVFYFGLGMAALYAASGGCDATIQKYRSKPVSICEKIQQILEVLQK